MFDFQTTFKIYISIIIIIIIIILFSLIAIPTTTKMTPIESKESNFHSVWLQEMWMCGVVPNT